MSQNCCTHQVWTVPPSPDPLWVTLGMGENLTQQPKIYSFPPSEKSQKYHFFPIKQQVSSNHPMESSFVAAVISVVSYFKFQALCIHTCHANLTNQCLLNVAFSMTKALNN